MKRQIPRNIQLRGPFAVLGMVLLLAACTHPNRDLIEGAPLISRGFKDYFGRQVVLRNRPSRVVSLGSHITETIYAIGAQDRLVGVSHDSDYPQDANSKTTIITYEEFDLPGVIALEPDLVLATTEVHDTRISNFFDRYKVNLFFQDCQTLEDIFKNIRITGEMLGKEQAANHLADSLAALTKTIADSTAGQIQYNTVILLGIDPITVVGPRSFMNDLLVKAGAKNAFANHTERYPTVTAEEFIRAAPEYVLIPTTNDKAWNDLVALHPEIQLNIPAAQNHHIFQMEPDVIVRPGPRIVEGLAYLTRVLHARVNLPM